VQLYDLAKDIGETNNLAAAMPETVIEMQALLDRLISSGRSSPGAVQKNATIFLHPKVKNVYSLN
ncbi:MAG: hypothetical protein ACQUYJ_08540, partial [Ferruginibacter sp.]